MLECIRGENHCQVEAGIRTGFSPGAGIHQQDSLYAGAATKESGEFLRRFLVMDAWIGRQEWYQPACLFDLVG